MFSTVTLATLTAAFDNADCAFCISWPYQCDMLYHNTINTSERFFLPYNSERLELCYKVNSGAFSTLQEYFLFDFGVEEATRPMWTKPCVSFHCSIGGNYFKSWPHFV